MTRMNIKEFKAYLIDSIRDAENRTYLEEIGKAVLGEGVKFVPLADGFEISDDTMPEILKDES